MSLSALESTIKNPVVVAVLTLLGSAGGGWLKDKLKSETQATATEIRLQYLEKHEENAVQKDEFNAFVADVLRRLDRIERKVDGN